MKRKMTLSFDGEKLLHISVTEKGRKKKLYPVKSAADVLVQTNNMLDVAQIAVASAALEELDGPSNAELLQESSLETTTSEEVIPSYILERIDFLTKVGDLREALDFAKNRAVDYPSSPVLKELVTSLEAAMESKRTGCVTDMTMEQIVAEQRLKWIQRETSGTLACQHALQHPVNSAWPSDTPRLPSMVPPTRPTPVFEEVPIASLSDADKTKTVCARPKKQATSSEE